MLTTTNPTLQSPMQPLVRKRDQSQFVPPYHVILFDDDDHTYEYVVGMIRKIFGRTQEEAIQLANQIDDDGKVILETTTLERAELKRDQIISFGRDWRLDRCKGSMTAMIEPATA